MRVTTTPRTSGVLPASTGPIEPAGDEIARLTLEIARLAQENDDLHESARIWIWLYEKQLERANNAVAELKAVTAVRQHSAA